MDHVTLTSVLLCVILTLQSAVGTAPTGCSDEGDGVYHCDYDVMTQVPVNIAGFGSTPEHLKMAVSGFIPQFGKYFKVLF